MSAISFLRIPLAACGKFGEGRLYFVGSVTVYYTMADPEQRGKPTAEFEELGGCGRVFDDIAQAIGDLVIVKKPLDGTAARSTLVTVNLDWRRH